MHEVASLDKGRVKFEEMPVLVEIAGALDALDQIAQCAHNRVDLAFEPRILRSVHGHAVLQIAAEEVGSPRLSCLLRRAGALRREPKGLRFDCADASPLRVKDPAKPSTLATKRGPQALATPIRCARRAEALDVDPPAGIGFGIALPLVRI